MLYLFLSVTAFICFVSCHALAVRLQIIRFQSWALFLLSVAWLSVFFIFANILGHRIDGEPVTFFNVPLVSSSVFFYLLLCLWYVIQCTAVERWSPSMKIVYALTKDENKGLTREEIRSLFSDEELILSRLNDLAQHGHIRYENQRYYIARRGRIIVQFVLAYRKLLGKDVGG